MEKRTLSEKELLLYQAVIELLDEGMEVHQIKVSDITNRAGVGKGTAYEYFSSKEEMIAKAIYWHGNQRFLELVENLKRQKSLKDQLMEVFNFIENVVYKDNGCRQLFKLPQSEEKAQKEIEEKMKSAREYAQTVLELIAKQGREENSIHPEFSDFQIFRFRQLHFQHYLVTLCIWPSLNMSQKNQKKVCGNLPVQTCFPFLEKNLL